MFVAIFQIMRKTLGTLYHEMKRLHSQNQLLQNLGKKHTKNTMENKQAILLLSGGIDSTTLLSKLSSENYDVIALSFHYGQRHGIELNYSKKNAEKYSVKKHHIIELDNTLFISSALVNTEIDISTYRSDGLPEGQVNAYVPFRNLLFSAQL